MRTDDEIRAALHSYAETTATSPDAWARINERAAAEAPAARRRARWTALRPVLAVIAAVAVVAAAATMRDGGGETDVIGFAGAPLRGTAFAFGISAGLDDVVRIDLATGRTDRLTVEPQNHAGMAVVNGTVYVAGRDPSGLLRLEGVLLQRVPGAPAVTASAVGPGPDGTVLWVGHEGGFEGPWELHQWDPRTSSDRVVHTSMRSLSAPAANPAGEIAFLEDVGYQVTLSVLHPDGRLVRHPLKTRLARTWEGTTEPAVAWGADGLVAVSTPIGRSNDDEPSTLVVNGATGKVVKKVTGWAGAAWSPDGTTLLLADGRRPSGLAVLRGPDFDVERLPQRTAGWMVGRPVAWLADEIGQAPPVVVQVAGGQAEGIEWSVSTYHHDGQGCLEFRSGLGARAGRCDAPEVGPDKITAPAWYRIVHDHSLLLAYLPLDVGAMTVTFTDGTVANAQVVPVVLGETPLRVAVLVTSKPVRLMEAGGVVLECVPDRQGCARR